MDRLTTMMTFEKVVKHASFTAAAEELGLSRAVVSRHIADLEEHFGLRLLNRTTRSVTPTQAGKNYYDLCQRILSEVHKGEESIAAIKSEIEGEISVLCPVWVGNFDISEAIVDFLIEFPRVGIKLNIGEVSHNPHDFLAKGYDICIQPNEMPDSDIIVKKIGHVKYILVASPDYLRRRGDPKGIRDLVQHDCLVKLTEPSWLFKDGERVSMRASTRFSSNSYFSLCMAALAGLGIAMLPRQVAMVEIEAGLFRTVLPHIDLEIRPLYAAYAPGGTMPRKVRELVTFLADWFARRAQAPDAAGKVVKLFGAARNAKFDEKSKN